MTGKIINPNINLHISIWDENSVIRYCIKNPKKAPILTNSWEKAPNVPEISTGTNYLINKEARAV